MSNKINNLVSRLINKAGVMNLPIDVVKMAKSFNLEVKIKSYEGNDELSGVLIRDEKQAVIGVNANHSETRQRFTIAHELGHYFMHEGEQLIIDKSYSVNFRHSTSIDGSNIKEIEANTFAGLLLIPTKFLLEDLKEKPIDFLDQEAIKKLALKYNVSEQAMSIRLAKL